MTMDATTDTLSSALAERREAIESRLAEIEEAAVHAAGGIGFGKRVGEGTNIAVQRFADVAVHDGLQAELSIVRRAEAKIADGTTGRCDHCGATIPDERREAIPWAVACVGCAS